MNAKTSSAALCVAVFIQMVGVGLIVALLPSRVITISGSMEHVGYIASAFAVPFVLLQLPVGRLGDRYGYRGLLATGYVISCLTGLLYFRAETVTWILAGRMLQGVGEIPVWALAPALLSLLFAKSKGEAIGKYNASLHLGLTAGSLASAYFLATWGGNEAFLLYAATGGLGALVVLLFVRDPKPSTFGGKEKLPTFSQVLATIRKTGDPQLLAGVCLYGGAYGAFITVIPGVLIAQKGFSQSMVAFFFALFYIAISLSQIYAGRITDNKGPDLAISAGLLLLAAGTGSFIWFSGKAILACLFLASCGLGFFCVSSMVLLNEATPPSLKGSISGAFYALWGTGFFLIPPLLTWIGELLGYHALFVLFSLAILLEMVLLRIRRNSLEEE